MAFVSGRAYVGRFHPFSGEAIPATCEPRDDEVLTAPHASPNPECDCGYRIVRDLDELKRYRKKVERFSRLHRVDQPDAVYARVRGFGTVTTSQGYEIKVGEGCIRAERLSLAGEMLIPRDLKHFNKPLKRSFPQLRGGIRVVDSLTADR